MDGAVGAESKAGAGSNSDGCGKIIGGGDDGHDGETGAHAYGLDVETGADRATPGGGIASRRRASAVRASMSSGVCGASMPAECSLSGVAVHSRWREDDATRSSERAYSDRVPPSDWLNARDIAGAILGTKATPERMQA